MTHNESQPDNASDEALAIAATIDPVAFDPISLNDTHPGWQARRETATDTAKKILAIRAPQPQFGVQNRDAVIEECARIADDHTPKKHEGTLAAHVTGSTIAKAIRSLALSSAPRAGVQNASDPEASIPTYGNIPWDQLGRDVVEAQIGTRRDFEFDPKFYPGHQSPGINFNSLARIVDKYRLSSTVSSAPRAGVQSNRDPAVVAAVQEALMKHPHWKPGLGSSAFAFGLANTAIDAYTTALSSPLRGGCHD